MDGRLEKILKLVRKSEPNFTKFSEDIQQIHPILRVRSISKILESISLPKNSTILDIGTGYGYGSVLLNSLGYNVIGLDSNKKKLEEGMNYWSNLGISFEKIDNLSLAVKSPGKLYFSARDSKNLSDLPDKSIDMATAFYISGYMVNKNGAFSDVGRVLKDQGEFVITTQGYSKIPKFLRGFAVNMEGRIFQPNNLKLKSTITLSDPVVHDRFVLVYGKR